MNTILFLLISLFVFSDEFKTAQLKYSRVKSAYTEKEEGLKQLFKVNDLEYGKTPIFIRVFKDEKVLELWGKNKSSSYTLIKSYPICSASGDLGPKRKMGDYQVPEGFYRIDRFNPQSSFFLSLGINYPNASDKILGNSENLGGDIFIHGSCVSIGCMAMTDPAIKEIYVAAVQAKNNGQSKIPVHIFPFRMSENNLLLYSDKYKEDVSTVTLWKNLKTGFDFFEKSKKLPSVSVNSKGVYLFQ